MKIFLDTDVLIAAFISRGTCKELFEYCLRNHSIYTSRAVLDELKQILSIKLKYPETTVSRALKYLGENLRMVDYQTFEARVCRDAEDDKILASALSTDAECLITGDEDLLALKEFSGISIIRPSDFWKFEKEGGV